jgi:hypothetical protein
MCCKTDRLTNCGTDFFHLQFGTAPLAFRQRPKKSCTSTNTMPEQKMTQVLHHSPPLTSTESPKSHSSLSEHVATPDSPTMPSNCASCPRSTTWSFADACAQTTSVQCSQQVRALFTPQEIAQHHDVRPDAPAFDLKQFMQE